MNIKNYIREVQDFPTPGISFKDISTLIRSEKFTDVITMMLDNVALPDYFVGIDSRGFIFASAMAAKSNRGLIMCRKKGKLPPPTTSYTYELEYGTDTLEMQTHTGEGTVVIVDDVYATGGTMEAATELCFNAGYVVIDRIVLIDLQSLHTNTIKSLVQYE